MRILYINALYAPDIAGGAELSLKVMVEGMRARGHEVAVLCLTPQVGLHVTEFDGVRVYRAGLRNGYWPFTQQRPGRLRRFVWHLRDRYNRAMRPYIREVIQRERPDVVSCHNLVGWSVAAWDEIRRAGIPIVQVLHDMYLLSPDSTLSRRGGEKAGRGPAARLLRVGFRKRSRMVAAVVAISQHMLDRFAGYGYFDGPSRYVVHNVRRIPDSGRRPPRREHEPLTVGYIGTLSPVKGVAWLISQYRRLDIAGRLRIAGRGREDDERRFRALAAGDERIEFVGYVDPGTFYSGIDVLVVPSLWEEPLGMVAVEGLANNLPVIASDRGGLRESVSDGHNGILCDPADPDSLGEAIRRLALDAAWYNRLASAARDSVRGFLDEDRMITAYEGVYYSVINHDQAT